MRTITESESTPRADGFFMPAEFAPQDRVWMGWPHRTDTWAHGAKPAQRQYAAIARAIAEFTPVYMCANQVDYANCKAVFENDVSVNLFFTSFAKQARRLRKGGFTGCANVFSPIPVTARRGRPSAGPSACRTCRLS